MYQFADINAIAALRIEGRPGNTTRLPTPRSVAQVGATEQVSPLLFTCRKAASAAKCVAHHSRPVGFRESVKVRYTPGIYLHGWSRGVSPVARSDEKQS